MWIIVEKNAISWKKSSEHVDFMGKNGAKKVDFIIENEEFIGKKGEQMLAEKGPV